MTEEEEETEREESSESEEPAERETVEERSAQKLTKTASDGAKITVSAPKGALPVGAEVHAVLVND